MTQTVGVIGAYGSVGRVIVEELLTRSQCAFVLAGRDPKRLEPIAALAAGRCTLRTVDLEDSQSIEAFCRGCDIVVMAGPAFKARGATPLFLQTRIAIAAMRTGTHYMGLGVGELLESDMREHESELLERRLLCANTASWMPGLSELLLLHGIATAEAELDEQVSVDEYIYCGTDLGPAGALDLLTAMRFYKLKENVVCKSGHFTTAEARSFAFPEPIGTQTVYPSFRRYLRERLEKQANRLTAFPHVGEFLSLGKNAMEIMSSPSLLSAPLNEAGATLCNAAAADFAEYGGAEFLSLVIKGKRAGRHVTLRTDLLSRKGAWIFGVIPALVIDRLLRGQIETRGCRFLHEIVDAPTFLDDLAQAGVERRVYVS